MTEKKIKKGKTLFDHLKAITKEPYDPDYWKNLTADERRSFSPYMIHRYLSMEPEFIEWVNMVQQYTYGLSGEMVYKVYATTIPKSNVFLKYIGGKKEKKIKYDKKLIEYVCKYFEVSTKEAVEYIELMLQIPGGREELIYILDAYAIEDKEINKIVPKEKK